MSSNLWILITIVAVLVLPIVIGFLKDYLGFNSNKFYGDEANKNKLSRRDKTYQKSDQYWTMTQRDQHSHGGGHGDNGGFQ